MVTEKSKINENALEELGRLGQVNEKLRKERHEASEMATTLQRTCSDLENEVSEYKLKLNESETAKLSLMGQVEILTKGEEILKQKLNALSASNERLFSEKNQPATTSMSLDREAESPQTVSISNEPSFERMDVSSSDTTVVPNSPKEVQMAFNRSSLDFEIESYRLQREYELGMLKQLRETFANLQTITGLTSSALRDTMKQIDIVIKKQ